MLTRLDGFEAPIRVEPIGVPDGLTIEPVVLGADQFQAPIVVGASKDAAPVVAEIAFEGHALSPDRKEVLRYEPGRSSVIVETGHEALPVTEVWPSPNNPNNPFHLTRVTRGLPVAVIAEPAPLRLSVSPGSVVAGRKADFELTVEIDRIDGWDEPIQITATDLPPNVPAAKATVEKGKTSTTLKMSVPEKVSPGPYTFILRGTASYSFKKTPDDKKATTINLTVPSNPVALTVHE